MGDLVDINSKVVKQFKKRAGQNKKITAQEALNMVLEIKGTQVQEQKMMMGMQNAFGNLVNDVQNEMNKMWQHVDITKKMLQDTSVCSANDWSNAWDKYVTKPQEEMLSKHLEVLRETSPKDAYFANVIQAVRDFEFKEETDPNGNPVDPKAIKDNALNALLNVEQREEACKYLRQQYMENLPEFVEPEEVTLDAANKVDEPEERPMPDCKYCGLETCSFCNDLGDKE
jgi:predicted house-cleaning noncanonical NTP pyrophosphatase (MazG superfamily)